MMTFGSLFAGSGGFDMAFESAGMQCRWQVEIDPVARGVLARHWPDVPRYEDVRAIHGGEITPVDVITAGFPCQDLSVAGNRAGLGGKRSGLFWEITRIVEEMQDATNGQYPVFTVLENVPGLLSSGITRDNPGGDFACVLAGLGKCGASTAWRILDAQFFGVPQRRRRVFIVSDFPGRCPRTIESRAAQVLFESEGSGGDSPESGEAGQSAAGSATSGAGESGGVYALMNGARPREFGMGLGVSAGPMYTLDTMGEHAVAVLADTARSHPRPGSNSVENLTVAATVGCLTAHGGGYDGQDAYSGQLIATTVQASAGHHGHSSPRGDGNDNLVVAHCLNGSQERLDGTVETFVTSLAENQRGELRTADISPALGAGGGKPGSGFSAAWNGSMIRRLTPGECERLMGWPDSFTRWTADGKEIADGTRYRLIGNGVVSPVAAYIASRILLVEEATRDEQR